MVPLTNKLLTVKYILPGLTDKSPTTNAQATTMFEKLASNLIGVLTIVAVIFFAVQIIFAGYSFMSSAGDEKVMETSRKKLTNGVMGLFIVIVAVGIASLIAKLLGLNDPLDIGAMFTSFGL